MSTPRHMTALRDTPGSDLLNVDEVASWLVCSRRTVFRLLADGELPSIKPGRQRLVAAEDVAAYVLALRTASTS